MKLTEAETLHIIRAMGGLIKNLSKFTTHNDKCLVKPCNCGLDALLKNVKEMPL